MLYKSADSRQPDIDTLTALAARPDVETSTRRRIEAEIRKIRAGAAGEHDAAYFIDFDSADSPNRAVIHDLRIEGGDHPAQIDHVIVTRLLEIFVLETKHFTDGVGVNDHGEWVGYWRGEAHGIPSPIEQNRRHAVVLHELIDLGMVPLPRRLGITLKPTIESFVLVSASAKITRPRGKAAAASVDGLDHVIKADQLSTHLSARVDRMSSLAVVRGVSRFITKKELTNIASALVALHSPIRTDWAARFGLAHVPSAPAVRVIPVEPATPITTCAQCRRPISDKVAAYCAANTPRFGHRILCYDCQRATAT